MKTFQSSLLVLFLILEMNTSAITVREQLKQINRYWVDHPLSDKILDRNEVFASDRERIQLHLKLVERTLRKSDGVPLNKEQRKKRLEMLDVLNHYWVKGIFPQNTAHTSRTPYFIDVYSTACAVGQLIISSGNATLAKQISRENNNGYIAELALKYPQIKNWANEFGFTLEELAWIQPCYAPPLDTAGLRNPTCHNASNGYFCPDFSQLQGPLTKSFYRWQDTGWVARITMCGHWAFNYLSAGKYRWLVKDNLNTTHTFSTELVAPPPASITAIKSGDFNACNGIITVSVQGGVPPFNYYWAGSTQTTSALTAVCEGLTTLTFYEGGGWCPQFIEILTSPVGIKEEVINSLHVSPNPVTDILQLKFNSSEWPNYSVAKILNIQGQVVLQVDLISEHTNINLDQLPAGLYFLQVGNYKVQRIVKR